MRTLLNRRRVMGGGIPIDEEGYNGGYLTLTALEDTTFTLVMGSLMDTGDLVGIYYSIDDGDSWVYTANVNNQEVSATTPLIHKSEHVLWKGVNKRLSRSRNAGYSSYFSSNGLFSVGGSLQSMIWGDEYETKLSTKDWMSYLFLFRGSKVKNAKNLRFTATSMHNGTYNGLFENCVYLTVPPSEIGYGGGGAYEYAFQGCTSLLSSPDILIASPSSTCLKNMFTGCTSLKYIKILSTNISATNCLQNWVQNVPSGGTFVKASGVTFPSGASGIPNGWTVEEVTI